MTHGFSKWRRMVQENLAEFGKGCDRWYYKLNEVAKDG